MGHDSSKKTGKKLLIVFPDDWLPFSPTTLNLYDTLEEDWDVSVLAFKQPHESWHLGHRKLHVIEIHDRLEKILSTLDDVVKFVMGRTLQLRRRWRSALLTLAARKIKADVYIAVDTHAACAIQRLGKSVHLMSLELYDRDPFVAKLKPSQIKSVLTQSKTRLVSLAPHVLEPVFLIQNAPIFTGPQPEVKREGVVLSGSCIPEFGLNMVLKYYRSNPDRRLALHGTLYSSDEKIIREEFTAEIATERLQISLDYMESKQLLKYLHQFKVGFCFYDLRFEDVNQFNFWMAPSGKLFHYFAAGVPVIATDLPGMQVVRDFNAGILIRDDDPRTIRAAIEEIEATYEEKVLGCYKAASQFSFDKTIEPFKHFLKTGQSQ